MKVLAVSNVEGWTDRIVDLFEDKDVNIVAKESAGKLRDVGAMVSEAMAKGIYEYAIVAVDDHVGATVVLNKYENLRAAECSSGEDLKLARDNSVNVIIVKADLKRLDYLAEGIDRTKPVKKDAVPKQKEGTERREAVKEEEDADEEDRPQGKAGGGIMNRLKDSFGIVDR